jgi:hypothetical protein
VADTVETRAASTLRNAATAPVVPNPPGWQASGPLRTLDDLNSRAANPVDTSGIQGRLIGSRPLTAAEMKRRRGAVRPAFAM